MSESKGVFPSHHRCREKAKPLECGGTGRRFGSPFAFAGRRDCQSGGSKYSSALEVRRDYQSGGPCRTQSKDAARQNLRTNSPVQ
jgi:hypothetical protein